MSELTANKDQSLSGWDIWNHSRKNGRISGQPETEPVGLCSDDILHEVAW